MDQIVHVGVSPSRNVKLISREISFEILQPKVIKYPNVTDGQTDRRMDDILWHNRALRSIAL